jgi:hypothetical protein
MLDLLICVGVSNCCPIYMDVVVITEIQALLFDELVSLSMMIALGTPKWKTMP